MSLSRAVGSAAMHSSTCAWLVMNRQRWSVSPELDFMSSRYYSLVSSIGHHVLEGSGASFAALTLGRLVRVDPQRSAPSPRFKEPGMSISTPAAALTAQHRPRGSDVPRFRSRPVRAAIVPRLAVDGGLARLPGRRVHRLEGRRTRGRRRRRAGRRRAHRRRPRRRPVVGRQGRARARGSVDRLQRRRLRRRAGGRRGARRLRHRPRRARR